MNKSEYITKKIELENEYIRKVQALDAEYALSHAQFKIGDFLESKSGAVIKVEKIKVSNGNQSEDFLPEAIYVGQLVKKRTLTPFESIKRYYMHQSNVRNHIVRVYQCKDIE